MRTLRRGTTTEGPVPVRPTAAGRPGALFSFESIQVRRSGSLLLDIDYAAIPCAGATAIVGPSGSGKSTLLRLCNRLDVPTAGTVCLRGQDLASIDPLALRREVAMVFQQPIALPGTVAANLLEADPQLDPDGLAAALAQVGLSPALADRPAEQLSGGERQRLALARSLATKPSVILLDEATSALDPANTGRVEELVAGLVADGIHAVWVSHDLDALERIADHVVVMIDGAIAQQGPLAVVRARPTPAVAQFFEGRAA